MPILLNSDKLRYFNREDRRRIIQRKGGSYGKAIFLPKGESIFSSIIKGIVDNKDTIKNIADTTVNTASNVSKLVTGTIKDSEEIKNLRLKNEALEKDMSERERKRKKGGSFFLV